MNVFSSPEVVTAIAAGVTAIVAALTYAIKLVAKQMATFIAELKPNGGSSIKDQVTRLEVQFKAMEKHQEKIDSKLDKLYDLVIEHFGSK